MDFSISRISRRSTAADDMTSSSTLPEQWEQKIIEEKENDWSRAIDTRRAIAMEKLWPRQASEGGEEINCRKFVGSALCRIEGWCWC
jgi:hypothetical protein